MDEWSWTFKGYVHNGSNIIQVWYDYQAEDVKVEFEMTLSVLRTRSHHDWVGMQAAKPLSGYRGLWELRFKVQKVPYRPIGFMGVGRQVFTLLAMATKKDFKPQCKRAMQLMAEVEADPGGASNESECLRPLTRKA